MNPSIKVLREDGITWNTEFNKNQQAYGDSKIVKCSKVKLSKVKLSKVCILNKMTSHPF